MTQAKWTTRLSRLSRLLAVVALAVAGLGLVLGRYDLVPKIIGFSGLLVGGLVAILALVAGLAGLALNARHPTPSRKAAIIGIVLSLPFATFIATRPMASNHALALHDITTDLASPPVFHHLALRTDNLAGVGTTQSWRRLHALAYGDLKPVVIAKPAANVLVDAERIARQMGWQVANVDQATGQIEATASVSFIRFKDDVVIRVAPSPDGKSSTVDLRSVSRIGVGDLGQNAKHIRAFLKALAAG